MVILLFPGRERVIDFKEIMTLNGTGKGSDLKKSSVYGLLLQQIRPSIL